MEIDSRIKKGNYSSSEYLKDLQKVSSSKEKDHKILGDGKVKKYESYSKELSKKNINPYYKKYYEEKEVKRYKK